MPDPLDIAWRSANVPNPVLAAEDLAGISLAAVKGLIELGVLREAGPATHVVCDACHEQHVERVVMTKYPSGQTRFFIPCPENLRVEVPRERLPQWAVDFAPLLAALATALGAAEALTEVVPRRVWSLGRASLAGKSKPIWAARGLAWPDARQVVAALPQGRSPLLFFLGHGPDDGLVDVPREAIIELRTVVRMKDGVIVDREAIERQLTDVAALPAVKPPNKQSRRDATVGALKRELHERILSLKSAIRHADDSETAFDLPRLTQKELAKAIKVSESSMSRAIAESDDPWLKILLQTVESIDLIRKYSH